MAEVIEMELSLEPAYAFGALLRGDEKAAQFYDGRTQAEKQAILLQLHQVEDLAAFVRHLPDSAP